MRFSRGTECDQFCQPSNYHLLFLVGWWGITFDLSVCVFVWVRACVPTVWLSAAALLTRHWNNHAQINRWNCFCMKCSLRLSFGGPTSVSVCRCSFTVTGNVAPLKASTKCKSASNNDHGRTTVIKSFSLLIGAGFTGWNIFHCLKNRIWTRSSLFTVYTSPSCSAWKQKFEAWAPTNSYGCARRARIFPDSTCAMSTWVQTQTKCVQCLLVPLVTFQSDFTYLKRDGL